MACGLGFGILKLSGTYNVQVGLRATGVVWLTLPVLLGLRFSSHHWAGAEAPNLDTHGNFQLGTPHLEVGATGNLPTGGGRCSTTEFPGWQGNLAMNHGVGFGSFIPSSLSSMP